MTRVNPADASATIGVVIAQITSTDILTCIQALAQVTYTQNHVYVLDCFFYKDLCECIHVNSWEYWKNVSTITESLSQTSVAQ